MLKKGVYEYMDEWKNYNKTTLPRKRIYSNLHMKNITGVDYMHAKRVCRDFEIKDLGEYHNLYLKNDTLLLADVFKIFIKICLKIYHLEPTKILLANG